MKIFISILVINLIFIEIISGQDLEKAERKVYSHFTKTIEKEKSVRDAFLLVHSDRLNIHWNYYNDEVIKNSTNDPEHYC